MKKFFLFLAVATVIAVSSCSDMFYEPDFTFSTKVFMRDSSEALAQKTKFGSVLLIERDSCFIFDFQQVNMVDDYIKFRVLSESKDTVFETSYFPYTYWEYMKKDLVSGKNIVYFTFKKKYWVNGDFQMGDTTLQFMLYVN